MDINLLNVFLNEMLGDDSERNITNDLIINLVKTFDPKEKYWHVENKKLWRVKYWRIDQDRRAKIRENNRKIMDIADLRKAAADTIIKNVSTHLKLDRNHDLVLLIVNQILKTKSNTLAKQYGVDLDSIPELPQDIKYTVIEDRKERLKL